MTRSCNFVVKCLEYMLDVFMLSGVSSIICQEAICDVERFKGEFVERNGGFVNLFVTVLDDPGLD